VSLPVAYDPRIIKESFDILEPIAATVAANEPKLLEQYPEFRSWYEAYVIKKGVEDAEAAAAELKEQTKIQALAKLTVEERTALGFS